MATISVVAIYPTGTTDPTGSASVHGENYGNTYTTMNAMEVGENGDLTDAGGTWLYVEITPSDGNWNTADSTVLVYDGWKCNMGAAAPGESGEYVYIVTVGTARNDYSDGKYSTSAYRLETTGDTKPIIIDNDAAVDEPLDIVFDGVQISHGTSNNNMHLIQILPGAYHDQIHFENCYLRQLDAGSRNLRILCDDGALVYVINCILEGAAGDQISLVTGYTGTTYVYNSTICGATDDGFDQDAGTVNVVNCAVFNNGGTDFEGTINTQDYCASDDGGGTNGVDISPAAEADGWNAAFTDYANGDYTVKDTDSVLYLTSEITQDDDGNVPATDIMGNSRNTGAGEQVCIGAFEFAAAAGLSIPIVMHHRKQMRRRR